MKIRRILVSQPVPPTEKSPYFDLAEKYNLKIDFKQFIDIKPVEAREFRKEKINILDHTAVLFTSKTAIDHFFRICDEMRITIPDEMKYFCVSEAIAFYLQKYIVYRKRKIFYGNNKFDDLLDIIRKHSDETFLLPLSDIHKQEIPQKLEKAKIKFNKAILYRTISADLSDMKNDFNYDILVFFSPQGISSLIENFPSFEQNDIKIAAFGPATSKAVKKARLRLDIQAPLPEAPSMTMALDLFLKRLTKDCKK